MWVSTIPPAPLLPRDTLSWPTFLHRTYTTALEVHFTPHRLPELRADRHTRLIAFGCLLWNLEIPPAEWVRYRFRSFVPLLGKQLPWPPMNYVFSEKSMVDAIDHGLSFLGELGLATVQMSSTSRTVYGKFRKGLATETEIAGVHQETATDTSRIHARVSAGEYVWSGGHRAPWHNSKQAG